MLAVGSAPRSSWPHHPQTHRNMQCQTKPTGVPRPGHSRQLPSARRPGPVYAQPLCPSRPGLGGSPPEPGGLSVLGCPRHAHLLFTGCPGWHADARPGGQPSDQPRGYTALSAPGTASVSHSGWGGGAGRGSCQRPHSDWADAQAQGPDSPALPGQPRCPHMSPY